jgi:hypothetical protein
MNEIRYLKAYLIYTLCGTLAGVVAGGVQGFILGLALGIAGVPMARIPIITGITGFLAGGVVGFFIFRWSIRAFVLPQLATAWASPAAPEAIPPPLPGPDQCAARIDEDLTINNVPSE